MILSDTQILEELNGDIKIVPFRRECLGSNSYDVHLAPTLGVYSHTVERPLHPKWLPTHANGAVLDAKKANELRLIEIPDDGVVIYPDILYLGATEEYTETHGFVPFIEGKSSTGRLGISIHATAGRGDAGFMNHWTLEISCIQPVRIYKGMPIGQLIYFQTGPVEVPYNEKKSSVYAGAPVGPVPVASAMWKNFDPEKGWR